MLFLVLLWPDKNSFGHFNWGRVVCQILLKMNPVFLLFRMYKSYLFMTLACLWTEALISSNSCLWFFRTLSLFSPLWVVTAEDWAVAVCCTDSALVMLFSGSRAFIHLLGSWLLSLGVPGDSGSWIVLTDYAKLVSFSFLVVHLSCRLPVLLSSVVKLGVSDVLAEVESCSSVSVTTWYQ